jgi:hypothetical protein
MKSRKTSSADRRVLVSTLKILDVVGAHSGHTYAHRDYSPTGSAWFRFVAESMGARLVERPLPDGMQEMALPGYFGRPRICVNSRLGGGRPEFNAQRELARRHGLAHLVAGELGEEEGTAVRFMSSIFDWTSHSERTADTVALADLVSDGGIETALLEGLRLGQLPRWTMERVRAIAPAWPRERVLDRAGLRVALYYELHEAPQRRPDRVTRRALRLPPDQPGPE